MEDFASGKLAIPDRMQLSLPNDGVMLVMPAANERVGLTKAVTVHPGNKARENLPVIQGQVSVLNLAAARLVVKKMRYAVLVVCVLIFVACPIRVAFDALTYPLAYPASRAVTATKAS